MAGATEAKSMINLALSVGKLSGLKILTNLHRKNLFNLKETKLPQTKCKPSLPR